MPRPAAPLGASPLERTKLGVEVYRVEVPIVRVPSLVGGSRRSRVRRRARSQREPTSSSFVVYVFPGVFEKCGSGNLLGVFETRTFAPVVLGGPGRQGGQVPAHDGWQPENARAGRS